jgi:transposase-like protein
LVTVLRIGADAQIRLRTDREGHRPEGAKEFKIEAVELVDKIDNSAQAERDLGIPHGQIYKWRKKLNEEGRAEKASPGKGNVRDAKMKVLKRRLDRLEEENAIL